MSRFPAFTKTLRDQRVPALSWAVAMLVLAFVHVIMFPQYREAGAQLNESTYMKGLAGAAGGLDTPAGYMAAEFFSAAPLLVLFYAVIAGTGVIAGEEGAGTLDLLLAQPVSRRRLLLEKSAALALLVTGVAMAAVPGLIAGKLSISFDMSIARMVEASLNMAPISLLYLCIALLAGSAIPSRTAASIFVITAAIAGFFLTTFGSFVDALGEVQKVSPFYWTDYAKVLVDGTDVPRTAGFIAASLAILALAVVTFERRDVSAGARSLGVRERLFHLLRHQPSAEPVAGSLTQPPAGSSGGEPSSLSLLAKTLRDQRVPFFSWAACVFVLGVTMIAIYPAFHDAFKAFDEAGSFKELAGEAGSISSPAGYLSLEFFSYVPVIVLIAVIIAGSGAIAGEEGAGTLELLLAQPIRRRRVVLEKAAALVSGLVVVVLAGMAGLFAAKWVVGFDLSAARLAEGVLTMFPIGLFFLSLALFCSATLPGRTAGTIIVVAIAIGGYFLNTLGIYLQGMGTLRKLSPFYWSDFSHAMVKGFDWPAAAVFIALSGALLVAAAVAFERRDVSSSSRTWHLPRLRRRVGVLGTEST